MGGGGQKVAFATKSVGSDQRGVCVVRPHNVHNQQK